MGGKKPSGQARTGSDHQHSSENQQAKQKTPGTGMRSFFYALVGVVAALALHVANNFGPVDSFFPDYSNPQIEKHFTDSYYTARALFRSRAQVANAELHTLPVKAGGLDLTIDVAVIRGAKDQLVLHLSGTHGVEGFAGSAVQSAILEDMAQSRGRWKNTDANSKAPTVVFVHAVNPFGFAQLRRFNEHNVDLNRNYLSPEEFKSRKAKDPNENGYMNLYSVLNPPDLDGINGMYWAKVAYYLANYGFQTVKRATVCGNYHFNESIFYGGSEKQQSLQVLESFLKDNFDLTKIHQAAIVDVHTGLGPAGYDTLMAGAITPHALVEQAFKGTESLKRIAAMGKAENDVTQGYDAATGFVAAGLADLFSSAPNHVLAITQEFGTVPGVFVLKALIEENAMFNHGSPSVRLQYAERLRDVFYLHRSASWKRSVIERGFVVFEESVRAVNSMK